MSSLDPPSSAEVAAAAAAAAAASPAAAVKEEVAADVAPAIAKPVPATSTRSGGDSVLNQDATAQEAITTAMVAGAGQVLQQGFPSMIISDNAPAVVNLKSPLTPAEVLYWVLMPQGDASRLTFPRMTSPTGMAWMTPTSNLPLNVASPEFMESWRLIYLVDHHSLSPIDGFDVLKTLYGSTSGNSNNNGSTSTVGNSIITGIGTVLASQIPTAVFNMPPFDHYRLNDLVFHYMNCKTDFLRSQFKLTTAQIEQLDDFLWNSTADASHNLSSLLALSIQMKIQCTHVHGFLYVMFFHKCHPFVTPENTFVLFKYLEHQKQALDKNPILTPVQLKVIDQARWNAMNAAIITASKGEAGGAKTTTKTTTLDAAEAAVAAAKVAVAKARAFKESKSPNKALPPMTITSLSKAVGLPKRMVFYILTALHTGQPLTNLPEAQFQAIQEYLKQKAAGYYSDLDQKPSAKRALDGVGENDHEQQQPSKQAKILSSSDSALIAAPQNDCHESALTNQQQQQPPPQRQSIFGGVFLEGSSATSTTTTAAVASPLSQNSMPNPPPALDIMKNSAATTTTHPGSEKKDDETGGAERPLAANDGNEIGDTGNNNNKPFASAAARKNTALLDWFVLSVALLIVFYLVVTSYFDLRASTAGPDSSKLSLNEEILLLSTKPKMGMDDFFQKTDKGLEKDDLNAATTIMQQQQVPQLLSIPKPKLGLKDVLNKRDRGLDNDDLDSSTTIMQQQEHEEIPPPPPKPQQGLEDVLNKRDRELDNNDLDSSTMILQQQEHEEIPPLPPKPQQGLEDFFDKKDSGLDNDDLNPSAAIKQQQESLNNEL